MRYLSDKLTQKLMENSSLLPKATLKFADGTSRTLTGDDFCSMSVEQASSSSGSFDIGAAIVGQLSCTLNNYDDRFSECDFTSAELTAYVGQAVEGGTTEWVRLGVFTVDQPDAYSGQISITALDNLSKLEEDFDPSTVTWPTTLQSLAQRACDKCGLLLATSSIPNGSYVVKSQPSMSSASYLDLMGYIAQATGTFVRADDQGRVEFLWYDLKAFENEDWLLGGYFDDASPYATGGAANGGNFTNYSSGDSYDGGSFENMRKVGIINRFTSMTVNTDDVVVTGVQVTAANEVKTDSSGNETNGADGETALYGSEGYVLSISSNPLVLYGNAATVAAQVGERVVGIRFRPFSGSTVTDPSLEPGDAVVVYDRKDNQYESYLTSTTLTVNGAESVECSAKSASRNSASSASAATKAVVEARNELKREQTAREIAAKAFEEELSRSSGLYSTAVKQDDGSYIYYMHDKGDLASSKVVWKMTATAVGVSTNGPGGPYATGLNADGTAILNRIYAIGLDADYINTGALTVKKDGSTVFKADVDTGECYVGGSSVMIGSTTATNALSSVATGVNNLKATYGTCSTAASTAAKVTSINNFALRTGATVTIKFSYANTASSPTLNVNSTGAKSVHYAGTVLAEKYYWKAGDILTFTYDGSCWQLADSASKKNARSNWANDTTSVAIAAGTVTFSSNTFVLRSSNMTVTSAGTVTANNFSANGTFTGGTTTGSGYGMMLTSSGMLAGYSGGARYGFINCSATAHDVDDPSTKYHGLQLQGDGIVRLSSPRFSTAASSSTSVTTTQGFTGTLSQPIVTEIHDSGDSIGWHYGTFRLEFINGLLVSYTTVGTG